MYYRLVSFYFETKYWTIHLKFEISFIFFGVRVCVCGVQYVNFFYRIFNYFFFIYILPRQQNKRNHHIDGLALGNTL